MGEEFDGYKEGDLVEVEITDGYWIDATVIYDQETRVEVRLSVPVVWVERTIIVRKSFFGLRTRTELSNEASKFVETMTFSISLIRDKTV